MGNNVNIGDNVHMGSRAEGSRGGAYLAGSLTVPAGLHPPLHQLNGQHRPHHRLGPRSQISAPPL